MNKKVLIVGGVAGGASAAARLRRLDEKTEIIMFDRGEYISFANCGLPYYVGGEIKEKSALTLQTPQSFNLRFNVDVRIFSQVVAIDRIKKTVKVENLKTGETYEESYDKLILSPGAQPIIPDVQGIRSNRVFTLRNIPDTYKIKDFMDKEEPKSAAIIGGGYIGVEMAENLSNAGISVSIVELSNQVIAPLDYDMACEVHRYLSQKGVKLYLDNELKSIEDAGDELVLSLSNATIKADMIILAIGVKPESGIAKEAGLDINERGGIITDEHMRTSDENIYAVGDAVEVVDFVTGCKAMMPLAGPANKQGRIAADNICGIGSIYNGTQGSAILKVFDMTVAATGISEKTARAMNMDYDKSFTYSASHAGYYPGAVNMSVKTIYERPTGKILGCQIIGFDGVDKRCDVISAAIRAGMTASDLTKLELCYAPPYSSAKDPVNMAGYVVENILSGKVKNFHWHEVSELQKRGDVLLIDTRTSVEYENGHIEGFVNIPLDSLRSRVGEIPKDKKVYITCQIGLRGYIACRILSQNGYDVYNLSGGYRLYHSIFGNWTPPDIKMRPETHGTDKKELAHTNTITIDACGLQCPGPVMKLSEAIKSASEGDVIEISTTDPAFASDIEGFCRRTNNKFVDSHSEKGITKARIQKSCDAANGCNNGVNGTGKNFIVFSNDLDKAIASFIMANAAAAMGRKVSMFFTFWGLNIIRKSEHVKAKKDIISRMFGMMMPKGSKKLGLSKMNMAGIGAGMIRSVMNNKNIDSLEDLIAHAMKNGVEFVACAMSMDVMGIKQEELIHGVKMGGATAMLAHAEESDMSLFI